MVETAGREGRGGGTGWGWGRRRGPGGGCFFWVAGVGRGPELGEVRGRVRGGTGRGEAWAAVSAMLWRGVKKFQVSNYPRVRRVRSHPAKLFLMIVTFRYTSLYTREVSRGAVRPGAVFPLGGAVRRSFGPISAATRSARWTPCKHSRNVPSRSVAQAVGPPPQKRHSALGSCRSDSSPHQRAGSVAGLTRHSRTSPAGTPFPNLSRPKFNGEQRLWSSRSRRHLRPGA